MSLQHMRERVDRVREIPLRSVLLAVGAQQDQSDKAKWHTSRGVISVTGCKFINWQSATGGGGAIDLVIHLHHLDFKGAMTWLCSRFPAHLPTPPSCETPKPDLKLPVPDPNKLSAMKRYLVAERRIRPALIDRLLQSHDLYADHQANAVFILRGTDHAPVGAELRGTGHAPWCGMTPGSRKNLGYFSIRDAHIDGIILCESAIDAISCFILHPAHWCISTAGANPSPSWLPAMIQYGHRVYCGFDADPTGDAMARAQTDLYPVIKRLRPLQNDWNDMLASKS
jgi:hypothetical protein